MTAREVARLHGRKRSETLLVRRHDDERFTVATYAPAIGCDAGALAQLVCDLGAHVGPVADVVRDGGSRWNLGDHAWIAAYDNAEVEMGTTPRPLDPQESRRLALTLLVAAAVAEQQAGEGS